MVTKFRGKWLLFPALVTLLLTACDNDFFGLFFSNDLNQRWAHKNTFHFLSDEDRNITLGNSYAFIVLSDIHMKNGDARDLEMLKNIIDNEVKFVVINGDISQSGEKEDIKQFIRFAESLDIPCYPVLGNHDIFFNNWPNWKDLIGSTCYRINSDSTTLLILDSANAFFGAKQIDWMEHEVKNAGKNLFVFAHTNIFVQDLADRQQFTGTRERAKVCSILKDRCDIMFMGHVHETFFREIGGVHYITTENYCDHLNYCRVSVSGNGINWEFKKL